MLIGESVFDLQLVNRDEQEERRESAGALFWHAAYSFSHFEMGVMAARAVVAKRRRVESCMVLVAFGVCGLSQGLLSKLAGQVAGFLVVVELTFRRNACVVEFVGLRGVSYIFTLSFSFLHDHC